ncbi:MULTISPECIES: hypothetical protein [unclassified Sphingomonas]|uniref:hypothetical protein n=1 Tax=unclassified Sphingomonas TaxID=196159 RepID=UPI0018D1FAAD|nr:MULTISPECIES: hypothetical protein [unclassified Sphingomonas]
MAIEKGVLDQLLAGRDPQDLFVKVHLGRIADIALSPLEEGEVQKSNDEPDFTKPLVLGVWSRHLVVRV